MWERFEIDGFESAAQAFPGDLNGDDIDEEEAIDVALRKRFETINLGTIGLTESGLFYDDDDETVTNVMRKIGKVFLCHS